MDKCELEAKNYQKLLECAAEWRNPPNILDRLKRAAHERARRGRGVGWMRIETLARIINGEPRGSNAIDGGGPRPAA